MPRPIRPWFRFYTEAFHDRKMLRLTPNQRWLWVAILGAARDSCEPGRLLVAEGVPMTVSELARYADVREKDVAPALKTMSDLGMVSEEDGVIEVVNFTSRQYESDNVTARTQAHRERSKEQGRNVPTSFPGTPKEHVRNTPETETETETEKKRAAVADPIPADFENWYTVYPKKAARPAALKAYRAARKKVSADVLLSGASVMARAYGADKTYCPMPATWLNQERWADEPPARPQLRAVVNDGRPEGW